jgi:Fe-S cluster assembly iron-binding protein IscA
MKGEIQNMTITITDHARQQIQDMMKEESDGVYLRFGVKGGGCSGLSYSLGFEYEINEELDTVAIGKYKILGFIPHVRCRKTHFKT